MYFYPSGRWGKVDFERGKKLFLRRSKKNDPLPSTLGGKGGGNKGMNKIGMSKK